MSVEINVTNEVVEINEVSEIVEIIVSGGIGPQGPAGQGVPIGGTTGQVLGKLSSTNYDTAWISNGVPYTGATTNVDLGEFELKAGQVEFDQTPTGTAGVGVMRWNDTDGTVDLGLKGGNVTLQVGQEQVSRIVNKSGVNLTEAGYQVVKVLGAQGQRLSVTLAQANNDAGSAETLGIVTENININQEGYITTSGLVRGIDTRGVLQGETWAEGDMLYLSGTTAGALTKVKPIAPIHSVVVGYVISSAPNGSIFVKVTNGQELDELHNVAIVSVANNEALIYESATSLWKNKTIASALGYTPQAALTLTTTGSSGAATLTGATLNIPQYAAAMAIGGSITSATAGSVLFAGTAGVLAQDNANLFWDDTNNRLGIGTNTPQNTLDVIRGTAGTMLRSTYEMSSFSFNGDAKFGFYTSSSNFADGSSIFLGNTQLIISTLYLGAEIQFSPSNTLSSNSLRLNITGRNSSGVVTAASIGVLQAFQSGAVIINGTSAGGYSVSPKLIVGTSTVSTFMLDVNGTARVSGDALINGLTVGKGGGAVSQNTSVGVIALNANTTGQSNSAFGFNSLKLNTTGNGNSAFGTNALSSVVSQNDNTAIGNASLRDLTTGTINTAIGSGAMILSTSAASNTAVGYFSLSKTSGSFNTAVGVNTMINATTGSNNSAFGISSMSNSAITGNFNNAFGINSLQSLTSGEQNTGIGNSALNSNTTGSNNTAVGRGLQSNTTGSNNIGIGWTSGYYNTTENNQLYISSLFFASLSQSKTNSIIYGIQNAIAESQILRLNAATGIGLSADPVASAQLQVDSTTKGFLPPRMTNAQRTAIATPAVGLIVYCTDATEGLYIYKSTGWTFII